MRHGPVDEDGLIDRVVSSVASRRARLDVVREHIAQLEVEAQWLCDEISGREQSLELLLTDVLARIGRLVEDAWSPVPVLGFRMWTLRRTGLHGAKVTWRSPSLVAECLSTGERVGLPHVDGRCGRLGCGVYATKELRPLLTAHLRPQSHGYAVGLVALAGRVVEHEFGYRAERAQITALVGVGIDAYLETVDPERIAAVCRSPEHEIASSGARKPPGVIALLEQYLEDVRAKTVRERSLPWTSGNNGV